MPYNFQQNSSWMITAPNAMRLNDLDPFTICSWIFVTSMGLGANAGARIAEKSSPTNTTSFGWLFWIGSLSTGFGFSLRQNRTNSIAIGDSFANTLTLGAGAWQFVVGQYRSSASPTIQLYSGSPTSQVVEVSTYTNVVTGAGALQSNSAYNLTIGWGGAGGGPFNGRMGPCYLFGAYLSLQEIQSVQFGVIPAHLYSDLAGYWPLWGNPPAEPDLSGNSNTASVSLVPATADGPPLGRFIRRGAGSEGVHLDAPQRNFLIALADQLTLTDAPIQEWRLFPRTLVEPALALSDTFSLVSLTLALRLAANRTKTLYRPRWLLTYSGTNRFAAEDMEAGAETRFGEGVFGQSQFGD